MKLLMPFLAAAALLWVAGCASTPPAADAAKEAASREEAQRELAGKLLAAFTAADAKAFVALLPEGLRKDFGVEQFAAARKVLADSLGEATGYEFLTDLRNPLLGIQIWKVSFRRQGSNGLPIEQDSLFRVMLSNLDGRPAIVSFSFL